MNEGRSLADRFRDTLAAREQPVKTSGGYGQGHPCAGEEAIQRVEVRSQVTRRMSGGTIPW